MNRLAFIIGLAFGFVIAAAGLNDYNVGLSLREPHVYLILASAVAVAMPLLWLFQKRDWRTPLGGQLELANSKVERKHLFGAMCFGTGWAVAGSCPGPALAMATGGSFLALFVIAGLATGLWLPGAVEGSGGLQRIPDALKRRRGLAEEA